MYCKKCGNQLNDSAMFCPKCGQKVESDQRGRNTQTPSAQPIANNDINAMNKPAKKKKRKRNIIIIAVVVIIGFFWLIGRGGSSSTDSSTVTGTTSNSNEVGNSNAAVADSGNAEPAENTAENGSAVSTAQEGGTQATENRGTNLSVSPDGELLISRITDVTAPTETPDDGVWTVFVYMCGSNLESGDPKSEDDPESELVGGGAATWDLQEMLDATVDCPDLRFVVEAGGAIKWQNDICVSGQNTRLLISEGNVQYAESETANMGDPNTLFDFLNWGLTNYCSQYMVLDFWDHGGGSISGVCFDERGSYSGDGLSLMEIDQVLATLYNQYALQYEMIGCDACLMSTIEMANVLAPYAKYMIASEETEPGTGWDYGGFREGMMAGVMNGAELGKYICDAYFASCGGGPENVVTLSVIDLAKLDQFLIEFNSFCIEIYDYLCNQNGVDSLMSQAIKLPDFGPGYNSTDLGLFLENASAYSNKAEKALSLMDECIVYMRNGAAHQDVSGVAVYFPINYLVGSQHFSILKDICVTPYFIGIVDVCAYGKANAGDISDYDSDQWTDENSGYWSGESADNSGQNVLEDDSSDTPEGNTGQTGISFSVEPHCEKGNFDVFSAALDMIASFALDENFVSEHMDDLDKYTFTFSDEGLEKVDTVYTYLYYEHTDDSGRKLLTDYGCSFVGEGGYYRQNDQRTIEQVFLGTAMGLDNGDILSCYPLTRRYVEGYGYTNWYYAPVEHNGEKKYLIFYEYYVEQDPTTWIPTTRNEYIAVGTIEMDSGEMASRIEPLKKDDTLSAFAFNRDAETLEVVGYLRYRHDPYVCQEDGDLRLNRSLPYFNGSYIWKYYITDIYNNALYTNPVTCTIDHDQLWPYSIDD